MKVLHQPFILPNQVPHSNDTIPEVNFYQTVFHIVRLIPQGNVATYGQIAAVAGAPRAARQVGQAMAHCPADVPWQRVINRHGMISIENMVVTKDDQVYLLRQDGVEVTESEGNFWVDLKQYLVESSLLEAAHD